MGAWGTGIFDDDMALDAIVEIEALENPIEFFKSAFEDAVASSDYLEYDEGYRVIVSAVFVDGIINGTKYDDANVDIDATIQNYKTLYLGGVKVKAAAALLRVIGEHSELNELWSEKDDEYEDWKTSIQALIDRLS